MTCVFADTFYYLALLDETDLFHEEAVALTLDGQWSVVTTLWVLVELANALAVPPNRRLFCQFETALRRRTDVTVVPPRRDVFDAGLALYRNRPDKEWSLTDCISFVVMQRQGITDVLTGDHHFRQAGFTPLFSM
jgi:predicted nucleic acid-binding protein